AQVLTVQRQLELAQRPREGIELIRANLSAAYRDVLGGHERTEAELGQTLHAAGQERLRQQQAARLGVGIVVLIHPELRERTAAVDAQLGSRVGDLRFDDHEGAAARRIGEDHALLTAVRTADRRQIDAVDERRREEVVHVEDVLRFGP